MSDLDQDRESFDAPTPAPPVGADREKLQRLLLSAFVHQQEQVRKQIDHTGRLAAVLSIQQEITSREPDLEEVLSLVSNRAISIFGATGSAIALQRDGTMVCRASGGATGPALGAHLSSEFGLSGECLRTGQPVLCNNVDQDPRVDTAAARTLGIRSLIVAPVFHHRTTVGVFEVFSCEPDFFDKEDAHVVELLGGMITTAISYSSEFEAKQTLQSERSAMLEVIERITPTITRMLEQQAVAAAPASTRAPEELGESLPHSDVNEELAHSADVEFDDEIYAEAPVVFSEELSDADDVSTAVADTAPSVSAEDEHNDEQHEIAAPSFEANDEGSTAIGASRPTPSNDKEKRAVDSAIEILLSKEHVLEPEPADTEIVEQAEASEESTISDEPAGSLFAPRRRPIRQVPTAKPPVTPHPSGDFEWPEPEAPPLPTGGGAEEFIRATTESDEKSQSDFSDWTPPALLQTRTPVSAPRADSSGALVPSAASTTDFFTLSHDVPAIPATGAVKASKAVGAPSAPLGRSRGGMSLTLRLRNIMEYAVPAVLTGLLIVVGLQWLTSNQSIPSLLGNKVLKAPPPSMFTSTRSTPVEVSLLKIPGGSGLTHSG